jgi:hypothetical protein
LIRNTWKVLKCGTKEGRRRSCEKRRSFTKCQRGKNIIKIIKQNKANWIGHTVHRNCLLEQVIEGQTEGRIEMTVRRGRRSKQHLDDLRERR